MPPVRKRKALSKEARGLSEGYRSGLEEAVAEQIRGVGLDPLFETVTIRYTKPAKEARYTPDFPLATGVIIETKGRFVTADRQKHLLIKEQRPDLDIRFVFSNPNQRISKQSQTTYAMWCDKHGFKWAAKRIPQSWFDE
jgi:hypothetical protein